MERQREKIHLSVASDWLAKLDRERGAEPRSYYVERLVAEYWAAREFKRRDPKAPTPHEVFFGAAP